MLKKNYKLSRTNKPDYLEKTIKNPKKQRNVTGWGLCIVLIIAVFLVAWPASKNYLKDRALSKEIAKVEAEIKKYEADNQSLSEAISYLASDQALEDRARMDLNLKKPGEEIIVVKEINPEKNNVPDANANLSNPQKWWLCFFN
jgi:cell division protein FtsL